MLWAAAMSGQLTINNTGVYSHDELQIVIYSKMVNKVVWELIQETNKQLRTSQLTSI